MPKFCRSKQGQLDFKGERRFAIKLFLNFELASANTESDRHEYLVACTKVGHLSAVCTQTHRFSIVIIKSVLKTTHDPIVKTTQNTAKSIKFQEK